MKTIFTFIFFTFSVSATFSQAVAKMEIKEPITGLCNEKEVYALLPMFTGQREAACPVMNETIQIRLNNEVKFIKDNPSFKGKGMINIVVNCKGEVVYCKMDRKTGNDELDKQIEAVFNSLGQWKAGTLNEKEVDSSRLFSFVIKKGKIVLD